MRPTDRITLPTLAPRTADETAQSFGLRAFRFLVAEGLSACALDTDALELAHHASQTLVAAPDLSPLVCDRYHLMRLDMLNTIARRQREADEAAYRATLQVPALRPVARQYPDRDGGTRVARLRPIPIVPPAGMTVRPF